MTSNLAKPLDLEPLQLDSDLVHSSGPTLPLDIAYHVVEEIGLDLLQPGFLESLRSMALSCKGLCKVASKYLYADLTISLVCRETNNFMLKCEQVLKEFHEILIQGLKFPGLAMVYHLQAVGFSIPYSDVKDLRPISIIPAFRGVFDALQGKTHGIASLKFETNSPIYGSCPTPMGQFFDRQFYESFVALCRSPTLRTLLLEQIGLNPGALCGAHIENLHLEEFGFPDSENGVFLDLQNEAQLWGSPLRPISVALLNAHPESIQQATDLVDLCYPPPNQNKSLLLFSSAFSQITSLILFDYTFVQINVALFTRLRSLTVAQWNHWKGRPNLLYDFDCVYNSARYLEFFFCFRMHDLGTVVDLTIIINLHGTLLQLIADSPQNPWCIKTLPYWTAVDLNLATRLKLEHIHFVFNITSRLNKGDPDGVEQDKRVLQSCFPRVSEMAGSNLSLEIVDAESRDLNESPKESTARFKICKNSLSSQWDESTSFFRVYPNDLELEI